MSTQLRSLILSLLASLSMSAHATCENDVTVEFLPIQGTRFMQKPGTIRFFDRQNKLRDFQFATVIPDVQGNQIEKWAADRELHGTQLGIIRRIDLKDGVLPRFAAGFLPAKNLLLLLETPQGVDIPAYKHEVRHAEFNQMLRAGQCTPFAAHGYETFEELFTTSMHLLDVPGKRRAFIMGKFLDDVLHVYEALPVEELEHYRSLVGKVKTREIEMLRRTGLPTELPLVDAIEDLESQQFEAKSGTKSPFFFYAHDIGMHGRRFIAVHVRQAGLMPVTMYFANPGGGEAFSQLRREMMSEGFGGPLAKRLLDLVWARLSVLAALTKATLENFKVIQNEISQGRSGDEQVKNWVSLLAPFKQKIEPHFSVE